MILHICRYFGVGTCSTA